MARNHVSRNVPLRPVAKKRLKLMPADAWLGRMASLWNHIDILYVMSPRDFATPWFIVYEN